MRKSSDKIAVNLLIDTLLFHQVRHIVVSPGSRNAPLIIGLSESNSFDMISIVDERSAAFVALGIAQQTARPVVLLCTSGSALLNYAPAVAEAYYQRVPMLVVSADRPEEWIDQGDGQTIRQVGIYSNYIDFSVSLPSELVKESQLIGAKRDLETALYYAQQGPVHVNIPFDEPLYTTREEEGKKSASIQVATTVSVLDDVTLLKLQRIWNSCSKKMILIGQHVEDKGLMVALEPFLNSAETVVLCENTSNITSDKAIHCIDRTLEALGDDKEDFVPELLIYMGGAVVSKRIKQLLRQKKVQHVWKVGEDFLFMDTYQGLSFSIPMQAARFFKQFTQSLDWNSKSNYGSQWKQKDKLAEDKHHTFLETAPFSDLKAFELVLDCLPENSHLHLGNSSVVRYAQLFNPIKSINYWCNRGTSGIDGSMSTAVGAAYANPNSFHTLIIGDLSFFYDSNALWNQLQLPNLRIIVVNNGGGGIFKIIPGPSSTQQLEQFFTTQHSFSAEYICKAFDTTYLKATDEKSLLQAFDILYAEGTTSNRPMLLEIDTQKIESENVLKAYFKSLQVL